MKNILLILAVGMAVLSGHSARAEFLVCGGPGISPVSGKETKVFWFPDGVNRSTYMVLERRVWRADQLVSRDREAPVLVTNVLSGEAGHRKWTLDSTGLLEFTPNRMEFGRHYGSAVFVRPNGPEIAEMLEHCYLDASEVGFTVKN